MKLALKNESSIRNQTLPVSRPPSGFRNSFIRLGLACWVAASCQASAEVNRPNTDDAGKPEVAAVPQRGKDFPVKTFVATQPTKLDAAVADFVIELIRKNQGGVQDSYRKLTAATEEQAGRRYGTRRFEGIEWLVPEDRAQIMGDEFVHAVSAIYLARQQLEVDSHAAVHVPSNVVAMVRVEAVHRGKGDGPDSKRGWVNKGATVTLTFQGFLQSVPLTIE